MALVEPLLLSVTACVAPALLARRLRVPCAAERETRVALRLAVLRDAREHLRAHRDGEGLPEDIFAALESELDLEELRLRRLLGSEGHR